jgi:hypothetical protein
VANTHRYLAAGALALGVLVSAPACTTAGYYGQRTSRADYRELDRWAYNNGLREGRQSGERDARARRAYQVNRDREYQRADNGFYRRGNYQLRQYQQMFRQGFETGYSEAYDRWARTAGRGRVRPGVVPPYGGPGAGYPGYAGSSARNNGYNDGLDAGRDDARENRSFDPRRPKAYREGDRGYSNRDGSRDDYKQEYRAAFMQGYEQGYRDNRR